MFRHRKHSHHIVEPSYFIFAYNFTPQIYLLIVFETSRFDLNLKINSALLATTKQYIHRKIYVIFHNILVEAT